MSNKKSNKGNKYNVSNTYELNNDGSYISVGENIGYCFACGKEVSEGSKFCDNDCKRNYYSEIKRDLGGFEF